MRDAFGGTFLMYLIIIFVVIYISFLAASLKYVQAYRVKNQIINYIEQNEGFDNGVIEKIEGTDTEKGFLADVSYREKDAIKGMKYIKTYPKKSGEKYCSETYGYCVTMEYRNGYQAYYKVTTYLSLDLTGGWKDSPFPVLKLGVSGETRLVNLNGLEGIN